MFHPRLACAVYGLLWSDVRELTRQKRHRLVKGCGNAQDAQNGGKEHDNVKLEGDGNGLRGVKEETV